MKTLEEAIKRFSGSCMFVTNQKETCEQLAAWLRELQERRKQTEIIRCKDCAMCKKSNKSVVMTCKLHPFNPVLTEPDGYCKWAERRTECD